MENSRRRSVQFGEGECASTPQKVQEFFKDKPANTVRRGSPVPTTGPVSVLKDTPARHAAEVNRAAAYARSDADGGFPWAGRGNVLSSTSSADSSGSSEDGGPWDGYGRGYDEHMAEEDEPAPGTGVDATQVFSNYKSDHIFSNYASDRGVPASAAPPPPQPLQPPQKYALLGEEGIALANFGRALLFHLPREGTTRW